MNHHVRLPFTALLVVVLLSLLAGCSHLAVHQQVNRQFGPIANEAVAAEVARFILVDCYGSQILGSRQLEVVAEERDGMEVWVVRPMGIDGERDEAPRIEITKEDGRIVALTGARP